MALALAWSRSLADAHDVANDTPVTSLTSDSPASDMNKNTFVLCTDDEFMSLLEAPEAGSDQSQKGYSAVVRPVWSESELDHNLGNIKTQLLDQEGNKKNGKVYLQGTQLWSAPKADQLVEHIRLSTEALVWGERHDASLFDLFCEHHMLAAFVVALRIVIPSQVKVQILQSISILVQNTRRTTSFFFLLSGGQLNILFDDPPDMDDEEILTYFVTFLKSLALRLDAASACLCLAAAVDSSGQPLRRLPIFDCAVKLVGHRDSMVQIAARTALLSLLRIEDPLVRGAAGRATVLLLAPCLANIISTAHLMVQLDHDASKLKDEMEQLEDWLGFVGDLFVLGIPELAEALTHHGFSTGANGFAMWSDKHATGPSPTREREWSDSQSEYTGLAYDSSGSIREEGKGVSVVLEAASSDISASDRLEAVLKHYNDKEMLPFPYDLKCSENIGVILSSVALPLVPPREVRRAIIKTIQSIFTPEELCLEQGTKIGSESLVKLERRLTEALHPHARNSLAVAVLRSTVTTWAEVTWNAICRHALPYDSVKQTADLTADPQQQEMSSPRVTTQCKGTRLKRYHVYVYALMSETPYEKLATDNVKKATTSLHYNTMMGRTAIMYDQLTGRSTFKRDKRGNAYIMKAIRAAHDEYPCEVRDAITGNDDSENAT